jgi:serine/threonine protein kinase
MEQSSPLSSSTGDYSDEQLAEILKQSPFMHSVEEERVRMLAPNLLGKHISWDENPEDEAAALRKARQLGLRVPAVHGVVPLKGDHEGEHLLVMERVAGPTLEELWPNISFLFLLSLAWQLRSFVRKMHASSSDSTGRLASGTAKSTFLEGCYGPIDHASPSAFTRYLNWWITECRPSLFAPMHHLTLKPTEHVFIHQDLVPRNMIVDARGCLWIVDWGHAGFYPEYMEYAAMRNPGVASMQGASWSAWWSRLRWAVFCVVAGSPWLSQEFERCYQALGVVHGKSVCFRIDRPVESKRG